MENNSDERFGLGFFSPQDSGVLQIRFDTSDKLSAEDHEWLAEFLKRVSFAQSQTSFSILKESWIALNSLLKAIEDVGKTDDEAQEYWSVEHRGRRFIATVANYLSSSVMYVDSVRASASRRFGKESEEAINAINITNELYDNYIGYRICYGLRNGLLHTGALPLSISLHEDEEENAKVRITANRDQVLNAANWSKSGRKSLLTLESEFDLVPLLRDNWTGLWNLEKSRSKNQMSLIARDVPKLRGILDKSTMTEGDLPFVGRVIKVDDLTHNFTHSMLPDLNHLNRLEAAEKSGDVLDAFPGVWLQDENDGDDRGLKKVSSLRLEIARQIVLSASVEGFDSGANRLKDIVLKGPTDAMSVSLGLMEVAYILGRMCELTTGNSIYSILDNDFSLE
ncbi:hypothetical protein [uncultured Micrococcus sp.]|uniref:hypothetical protein n=1 Tax=uncultured Micrococcus sp. TaxID=114051 RepID=UPI0026062F1A|nr:hypothetical protein [uncultured Micrococcus sp.]